MCKATIQRLIKKLKVVFGGRYQTIEVNISIEINIPDNSEGQMVLKLKTVFGGKGQVQITTEIETEIKEVKKSKQCKLFDWDMRRLIH